MLRGGEVRIVYERAPSLALKALRSRRKAIEHFLTKDTKEKRRGRGKHREIPLRPHRMYFLPLSAIVSEAGLESAIAIGWRGISVQDEHVFEATVETVSDKLFRNPQHRRLPIHVKGAAFLSDLEAIGAKLRGAYQVCALTVPPLMTLGIWLRSRRSDSSRIIPIHSVVAGLNPGQPVYEKVFFSRLRNHARDLVEFAHVAQLSTRKVAPKPRRASRDGS